MTNKYEGIGISKKFANGTIHENASGTFQILDRYLNEENVITLKIQWLTGKLAGEVQENKENNINASIHKFQTNRGIRDMSEGFRQEPITLQEHNDLLKETNSLIYMILEQTKDNRNEVETLENMLDEKNNQIEYLTKEILKRDERLHDLTDKLFKFTSALLESK